MNNCVRVMTSSLLSALLVASLLPTAALGGEAVAAGDVTSRATSGEVAPFETVTIPSLDGTHLFLDITDAATLAAVEAACAKADVDLETLRVYAEPCLQTMVVGANDVLREVGVGDCDMYGVTLVSGETTVQVSGEGLAFHFSIPLSELSSHADTWAVAAYRHGGAVSLDSEVVGDRLCFTSPLVGTFGIGSASSSGGLVTLRSDSSYTAAFLTIMDEPTLAAVRAACTAVGASYDDLELRAHVSEVATGSSECATYIAAGLGDPVSVYVLSLFSGDTEVPLSGENLNLRYSFSITDLASLSAENAAVTLAGANGLTLLTTENFANRRVRVNCSTVGTFAVGTCLDKVISTLVDPPADWSMSGVGSGEDDVTTLPGDNPVVTATVKAGVTYMVSGGVAKVTKVAKSKKSVTIAKSVNIDGTTYKVSGIAAKAFKGTKVTKVTVKSTMLTKKSVKNCLKGSKVKTVKVPKAKKAAYTKIFKKAVCGKKVTVK